ncbi:MAG: YjjG family noncanonical pyrimidine nucleotidase [Bacteroidota bacterium]|nr:YjjG family noncanonical pyrimidine nucleotidase [Bacteroidota bacterium]
MIKYEHIFFDLDRTLWDFEENSKETLQDIFLKHNLTSKGIPSFKNFHSTYRTINHALWAQYRSGIITKEYLSVQRYHKTLQYFIIDNYELAQKISYDYITISPTKTRLFPYTHEILSYLSKKYKIHIITNGFNEVQFQKVKNADLEKYFQAIITSEDAGAKKPDPKVFDYALEQTGAIKSNSIMIGDDAKTDILGAKKAGIDQIFFNYHNKKEDISSTYKINSLEEIKNIL